jgi:hypothetical protein
MPYSPCLELAKLGSVGNHFTDSLAGSSLAFCRPTRHQALDRRNRSHALRRARRHQGNNDHSLPSLDLRFASTRPWPRAKFPSPWTPTLAGAGALWENEEVLAQEDRAPGVRCPHPVLEGSRIEVAGKGRVRRSRELVFTSPGAGPSAEASAKPVPGHRPTISGALPTAYRELQNRVTISLRIRARLQSCR